MFETRVTINQCQLEAAAAAAAAAAPRFQLQLVVPRVLRSSKV